MDLTRRSAPDALVLKKNMTKIRRGNAFTKKEDTNESTVDFEITRESPRDSQAGRKGTNNLSHSLSLMDRSASREKNTSTGQLPALVVDKN
jgi:hypothetical protein